MKTIVFAFSILLILGFVFCYSVSRRRKWSGCLMSGHIGVNNRKEEVRPQLPPQAEATVPRARIHSDTIMEVFGRLEDYFRESRPYLGGDTAIESVARHLFTNKTYVSRAVQRFTGLNYCQYVNRFRVLYAVELYRQNPVLRMNELAQMSGFNSIASFNISFRAVMNQSPGEWSRKYRASLKQA